MKKIAEFEKVSFNQFLTTMGNIFNNCSDEKIKEIYGNINCLKGPPADRRDTTFLRLSI